MTEFGNHYRYFEEGDELYQKQAKLDGGELVTLLGQTVMPATYYNGSPIGFNVFIVEHLLSTGQAVKAGVHKSRLELG